MASDVRDAFVQQRTHASTSTLTLTLTLLTCSGIYLDAAFEFGSSKPSITYANAPLGSSAEFKCIKVEIWAFK